MTVYISQVEDADKNQWDEYLLSVPNRLPMNSYAWKEILERVYGVKTIFLQAKDENGSICGILPTYITTGFDGTQNVFSLKGGFIADTAEVSDNLVDFLEDCCAELNVSSYLLTSGYVKRSTKYQLIIKNTMCMNISETEEHQWVQLRGKTRNMIRKSQTSGLVAEFGFDNLDEFYEIYLSLMLEKQLLPVSKHLFTLMKTSFGSNVKLISAKQNGVVVGGIIVVFGNGIATYPWQACLPEFKAFAPNQFLIWEAIKSCRQREISLLDMGESTLGGSVYTFKKNFGGFPTPVYYYNESGQISERVTKPRFWSKVRGKVNHKIASTMAYNSPIWMRRRSSVWLKSKGRII